MMTAKKRVLLALLVILTVAMTMLAACSQPDDDDLTTFTFVAEIDGITRTETVKTAKTKVGEALVDEGYIDNVGDGMFYEVFGFGGKAQIDALTTATSGVYWAFYVNGEYAQSGIFDTEIVAGATYTVKLESWDSTTLQ